MGDDYRAYGVDASDDKDVSIGTVLAWVVGILLAIGLFQAMTDGRCSTAPATRRPTRTQVSRQDRGTAWPVPKGRSADATYVQAGQLEHARSAAVTSDVIGGFGEMTAPAGYRSEAPWCLRGFPPVDETPPVPPPPVRRHPSRSSCHRPRPGRLGSRRSRRHRRRRRERRRSVHPLARQRPGRPCRTAASPDGETITDGGSCSSRNVPRSLALPPSPSMRCRMRCPGRRRRRQGPPRRCWRCKRRARTKCLGRSPPAGEDDLRRPAHGGHRRDGNPAALDHDSGGDHRGPEHPVLLDFAWSAPAWKMMLVGISGGTDEDGQPVELPAQDHAQGGAPPPDFFDEEVPELPDGGEPATSDCRARHPARVEGKGRGGGPVDGGAVPTRCRPLGDADVGQDGRAVGPGGDKSQQSVAEMRQRLLRGGGHEADGGEGVGGRGLLQRVADELHIGRTTAYTYSAGPA